MKTEADWRKRVHWAIAAGRTTSKLRSYVWAASAASPAVYGPVAKSELNDMAEPLREEVLSVQALLLLTDALCHEVGADLKSELEFCRKTVGIENWKLDNFKMPPKRKRRTHAKKA